MYEDCARTLHSHYREETESDIKVLRAVVVGESLYGVAYVLGNLAALAAAAAVVVRSVNKLYAETYGRRNLKHYLREIGLVVAAARAVAAYAVVEAIGREDAYASLSAVKDEVLVVNRNTAEFRASVAGNARFKYYFEVVADIYGVVASVESDLIYRNARPKNLGALYTDVVCAVDCLLTAFVDEHTEILETFLDSYGVVDLVCAYACTALHAGIIREPEYAADRVILFGHINILLGILPSVIIRIEKRRMSAHREYRTSDTASLILIYAAGIFLFTAVLPHFAIFVDKSEVLLYNHSGKISLEVIMAYSADVIKKVKEEFEKKRRAAQETADVKRAELHEKVPGVAQIDEVLASTGLRVYKAALDGGAVGAEIERMKAENADIRAMRAELLEKVGYPADYSDVKYECPLCSDTGYIGIKPCECFRKALVKESFLSAGLGSVLTDQTFDNFDLSLYSDEKDARGVSARGVMRYILSESKKYAEGFKSAEKRDNLFFFGATGLGKTHLSTAIAKRVIEEGMSVVYDTAQNIIRTFEAKRFSSGNASDGIDTSKYFDCDLLIIDDLGAEFRNSFTITVLYDLLNTRICTGKAMIISGNFDSSNGVAKLYDERISSRILGEFRSFRFIGEDIRLAGRSHKVKGS